MELYSLVLCLKKGIEILTHLFFRHSEEDLSDVRV